MILADSAIWIDHFRKAEPAFASLLDAKEILIHPFVIGEIALGHITRRTEVLEYLVGLPRAVVAADEEVLPIIGQGGLVGSGVGYLDAHLLVSVMLTPGTKLWTRDKKLVKAAERLGLAR
jgi:predicted nucleic acid-binding protein